MKTLQRQDGSLVKLTDEDAVKWIRLKLGIVPPGPVGQKRAVKSTSNKGVTK